MPLAVDKKVDDLRSERGPAAQTVKEFLLHLLPRFNTDVTIPEWPPDVFALCMSLIQKTGAYCNVLCDWPPTRTARSPQEWEKEICKAGRTWREACVAGTQPPKFVLDRWEWLLEHLDTPLSDVRDNNEPAQSLLELCAVADESCPGIGVPEVRTVAQTPIDERFFEFADRLLLPAADGGSSLCIEIHPSRACVLPKMHTPQSGLTIRSLSNHLALCSSDEIIPRWIAAVPTTNKSGVAGNSSPRTCINLLIVPWPMEVYPVQFQPSQPLPNEMRNMDRERFGFFTVTQPRDSNAVDYITRAIKTAQKRMGDIDGVILPELALNEEEYPAAVAAVHETGAFFICGRAKTAVSGRMHGVNQAMFDMPSLQPQYQHKHHRWKLEKFQIARYGLGSRLHPEMDWWEHIDLSERFLNFMALYPWLILSILICEDLARPDPVGDLVRAVGPNLVVALLMDGPQIKDRWSARYATTLADDPGCSVLTVTSLGMSKLSRNFDGSKPSRIVALWKDAKTATPVEISLSEDCNAVVISLAVRYLEEWAADGRSDHGGTGYPLLAGIYPIQVGM